jgi:hypothetical protein
MNEIEYNYSQPIKFIIGHAGTGKSTRLAELADDKSIVLTPTHKAKEVLERKGVKNVYTIHSVLKLVPTLDMNFRKKGKLQRLVKIGAVDLKSISHVIIDEYSMINTYIMDLLLDLLPAKTPVTIFGDSYQLPPVDGDPVEPDFYGREIETLTRQYRSEAPEVVETFTRFVNYLELRDHTIDLRLNPSIKKGSLKDFNPDTDRALAFTNAETISINNRIAKTLGLPKEISIGEEVSINGVMGTLTDTLPEGQFHSIPIYPACIAKGRLLQGSDLESKVDKIEHDRNKFNQPIIDGTQYFINIEGTVYSFYGDVDHYAHDKDYKAEVENSQLELINEYCLDDDVDLKDYCRTNKCELTRARGKAWSTYLGHQNLVFDLRRPFATTVHKAQGSEFETVYIDQDDLKKTIRGSHYETYARLMYVALSRAIKKVVII